MTNKFTAQRDETLVGWRQVFNIAALQRAYDGG